MQSIEFKRLNGLTPTESSCILKLLEEVGEVMEIIGKRSSLSGEALKIDQKYNDGELIMEYMDVAQSAVTAVFTLCEKNGLDVGTIIGVHEAKLRGRGYLK